MEQYPMKWHNFLIYFSLWAGAVMNVVSAVNFFSGLIYGGNAARAYSVFGGMKTVDMLMGVLMIGMAVFAIVTRFALAGYKANGPKLLLCANALNMVLHIVYCVLAASITGLSFGDFFISNASGIISSFIMLIAHKVYYDKRQSMFVN